MLLLCPKLLQHQARVFATILPHVHDSTTRYYMVILHAFQVRRGVPSSVMNSRQKEEPSLDFLEDLPHIDSADFV